MFWNNVKSLLKNYKITQKQLSVIINLPERTIENWIARNTIPDAIESVKIAQALNTTVEYLVTGTSSSLTPSDIKQLDLYRKIPDDLKDIVTTLEEKLISKKGD